MIEIEKRKTERSKEGLKGEWGIVFVNCPNTHPILSRFDFPHSQYHHICTRAA